MTNISGVQTAFAPAMQRLGRDLPVEFGCDAVRLVPGSAQDRPFSHVLRVAVHRGDDPQPLTHLFVKVFKPKVIDGDPDGMRKRVVKDFAAMERAQTALAGHDGIAAVRPIACYPDLLTIATEEAPGVTLLEYVTARLAWFAAHDVEETSNILRTVGRWIRTFQDGSPSGPSFAVGDIRDYIDIRLRRLVQHAGRRFTAADRDDVLRYIAALEQRIGADALRTVTAHSDLSLGNVLVAGPLVTVLDFAMTRFDTRLYDVTKVVLQLDLLTVKPQFSTANVRRLQGALLEGFDPTLTAEHPLFKLVMLQHRINHLTALHVNRAPVIEAVYNAAVRRKHRQWMAREVVPTARLAATR